MALETEVERVGLYYWNSESEIIENNKAFGWEVRSISDNKIIFERDKEILENYNEQYTSKTKSFVNADSYVINKVNKIRNFKSFDILFSQPIIIRMNSTIKHIKRYQVLIEFDQGYQELKEIYIDLENGEQIPCDDVNNAFRG